MPTASKTYQLSIRSKSLFIVLMLLAVFVFVHYALLQPKLEASLTSLIKENKLSSLRALSDSIIEPMLNSDIFYVHNQVKAFEERNKQFGMIRVMMQGRQIYPLETMTARSGLTEMTLPIQLKGKTIGTLVGDFDLDKEVRLRANHIYNVFLLLLGLCGIVFFMQHGIIYRYLIAPIADLSESIQRLSQKDRVEPEQVLEPSVQPMSLISVSSKEVDALRDAFYSYVQQLESKGNEIDFLLDSVPLALALTDQQGAIIHHNRAFAETFMQGREGATIQHSVVLDEKTQDTVEAYMAQTHRQELFKTINRQGERIDVKIAVEAYSDPSVDYYVFIISDVTTELASERAKGEFVSLVNHEIRTPLTAIRGSLGLMKHSVRSGNTAGTFNLLEMCSRNCQHLEKLVNDLLDMEKIKSGKMDFHPARLELHAAIDDVIQNYQHYLQEKSVAVRLNQAEGELHCHLDKTRLEQVVLNLVSNAIKHSDDASQVDINVKQVAGEAVIEVVDYGCGVSEDFQAQLFTKFSYKESINSRNRQGFGIGLYITKFLVEQMGGEIHYRDTEPKGASFVVTFPLD